MDISEARTRIRARAWQNLAQSDVDVSKYDEGDLQSVISVVADAALLELDEEIGQSVKVAPGEELGDSGEKILWEGRPFLSINTKYVITTERLRLIEGVLGKDRQDIELIRIQDLDQSQSMSERIFNVGDIHVRSHDRDRPEVVLRNVKEPEEVHEILRRAVLEARKRHKLTYREEM